MNKSNSPKHNPESFDEDLKFSSIKVSLGPSSDIEENIYDSDEEVENDRVLPLAPEIHEVSVMYHRDEQEKLKQHFRTMWKWVGKDLKNHETNHKIRIFTFTWNMFGKVPPKNLGEIFPKHCKHHIYAISTQECMRSIGKSLFYSSKKSWESLLQHHFGHEYVLLSANTIGATHLAIFVHYSIHGLIANIENKTIKTGVGNIIANKGGVAISFSLAGTRLLFIGCHLAAGQNGVNQRNNDFERIEKEACNEGTRASSNADFSIILGDLNYRINGSREDVEILINHEIFEPLLKGDQLKIEMTENTLFAGFQEGLINFPPSYRFDIGTSNYDTSKKQRVPSWTDRVIYKGNQDLMQKSYGCIENCLKSDHKPVFAQFVLLYDHEVKQLTTSVKSRACRIF